ncbi:cysteine-rich motor neuron 1 protein-like [Ptychodera flava]|uniref:cysteine-rich motor neuron 1 protein-like n=1 Tax=Ptychodera flava TaxID=63121 RepID=UPI00396A54A7
MAGTAKLYMTLYVAVLLIVQHVSCQDKGKMDGLQCPPCERIHCKPKKASRLQHKCPGSVTTGLCGCCPACAKQIGERCGGKWEAQGKCDRGLVCDKPENPDIEPGYYNPLTGVCIPRTYPVVSDDPSLCKPKCTPEFCQKNPREICSAMDNVEQKRECQGYCQHTSCRACRFVDPSPDCVKCAENDEECLAQFGRCVRKKVCTRDRFPCKQSSRNEGANFQCLVPECL